jgi:hypothetical protein
MLVAIDALILANVLDQRWSLITCRSWRDRVIGSLLQGSGYLTGAGFVLGVIAIVFRTGRVVRAIAGVGLAATMFVAGPLFGWTACW